VKEWPNTYDRDLDEEVSLDFDPKPNVWTVYTKKHGKEIKE
jgi:hypothetical protein